jgi:hypothetical protein
MRNSTPSMSTSGRRRLAALGGFFADLFDIRGRTSSAICINNRDDTFQYPGIILVLYTATLLSSHRRACSACGQAAFASRRLTGWLRPTIVGAVLVVSAGLLRDQPPAAAANLFAAELPLQKQAPTPCSSALTNSCWFLNLPGTVPLRQRPGQVPHH